MVVIRSPSSQLVPFKLHRFGQQRLVDDEFNGKRCQTRERFSYFERSSRSWDPENRSQLNPPVPSLAMAVAPTLSGLAQRF